MLSWRDGAPHIELMHRAPNGPVRSEDGSLRWPLERIIAEVEHGLRLCAAAAGGPVRSIAVDGWAVDYVRLDAKGNALAPPFCYRDPRTATAETSLHNRIRPERLRHITGLQLQPINTVYQLHADHLEGAHAVAPWLNLPEYLLSRWGGLRVAEYTNATHTGLVELDNRRWSFEILAAASIDRTTVPTLVPPGTMLGSMAGELARLPAFRATDLIAPACHDTASAIAAIPDTGDDWAYISSGTWSLVGTVLTRPCNHAAAQADGFTNLGGVGESICFHRGVNGLWLLKQCMIAWEAEGKAWQLADLLSATASSAMPSHLLDIDDPELMLPGDMPARINAQRMRQGLQPIDAAPANAPMMTSLVLHSLADRYRRIIERITADTGKRLRKIYVVGGGSRNELLNRLTEHATGLKVIRGSPEASTIGNFAVQLAALEGVPSDIETFREDIARWAGCLHDAAASPVL
jgi:rhamnulokinase